jgi:Glu-tRNA(Gln) amidotransferase subunit E-like FAD-binding protein
MATSPLRPNPFADMNEDDMNPEVELPEEDIESVIIQDDVEQEPLFPDEEAQEAQEAQEVLEMNPDLMAEIDDNPEPELFEPTPENYVDEVSDDETVVLNTEDQPPYLSNYESEDEDYSGSAAPAA